MSLIPPPSYTANPFGVAGPSPTYDLAPMGGGGVDPSALDDKTKVIGIALAVGSGVMIGSSFVFKKKGLLNCTAEGMIAGEGHAYLKSAMWWAGMLIMVAGEVCNFVAYAFVPAILVTPLGALSVVICAILSSIFLQERLNMQGKVGCTLCILGATVIVLHAPEQAAMKTIEQFRDKMIQPGFLTWMGIIIVASLILVFKVAPKWGKENMMVDISICSLIGSLSVVATQGLGAAIVHNISTGEPQFTNWFIYFVIVFVVVTLLIEINYLNKALNLFNTAMVTPTYYVTFTSTTILTSAILSQGFNASPVAIITVILGFLVICAGILLLQTAKPVVPVIVQDGKISEVVVGSVYDDFEPNAADLRASPFSSIRHFTRDLRHSSVPPIHHQPIGSRAESLIQRKRRASNAALSHRSRPTSMVSSLLSPVLSDTASATGINPTLHQTLVMGVEGRQVRLQLCEIVVSDESNGGATSRYPVYKPIITGSSATLAPPKPVTTSAVATHNRPLSTLFGPTFLAPRSSMMTAGSQHSTIRFVDRSRRPSFAYPTGEDHSASMHEESLLEKLESQPIASMDDLPPALRQNGGIGTSGDGNRGAGGDGAGYHNARPLSGSLFLPPIVDVSPSPRSGPLKVGGSFFMRPKHQHHGPSHLATSNITAGDEGDSNNDENDDEANSGSTASASHLANDDQQQGDDGLKRTLVSIEVSEQPQPILVPYVPPPPSQAAQQPLTSACLPLPASSSTSSLAATSASSPTSTTALNSSSDGHHHSPALTTAPVRKRRGVLGRLFGGGGPKRQDAEATPIGEHEEQIFGSSNAQSDAAATLENSVAIQVDAPAATEGSNHFDEKNPAVHDPSSDDPSTSSQSHMHASHTTPGHAFTRIHHPQRISEGEEEEDEEDALKKSST